MPRSLQKPSKAEVYGVVAGLISAALTAIAVQVFGAVVPNEVAAAIPVAAALLASHIVREEVEEAEEAENES
jgi:hypothetical protein